MNPTFYLLFAFSFTVLAIVRAERIDNRNFAIDTCFPNPNAIQLAESRAMAYWVKYASRFGAEPGFWPSRHRRFFLARSKTFIRN